MKSLIFILLLSIVFFQVVSSSDQESDDDFAEIDNDFDEFDFDDTADDSSKIKQEKNPEHSEPTTDFDDEEEDEEFETKPSNFEDIEDAVVEDVDSEFNHFADEEEFVNFNNDEDHEDEFEHMSTKGRGAKEKPRARPTAAPPKTIKITNIPAHLRNNWENYYLEMLMVAGIVVYFLNFFTGKAKNQKIANSWFNCHKPILESNFSLVGDDGKKSIDEIETQLQKDSENLFTLWCSGRTCVEGMLVELKLLKRQDLVSVISNLMKPAYDQVKIKVLMNAEDMDSYIFCLAQKKAAIKLSKEMTDIMTFCPEKKPAQEKYGLAPNSSFFIMSEIPEVTTSMLGDSKMLAMINKYPDAIDSIHFSDQYTGPKAADDQGPAELPEGKKVLIFTFNISGLKDKMSIDDSVETMKPLMLLVLYFIDKVKRFRLSREAKNKAEKNRSKVAEAFWKSIHAAKAERAQEERERKRREIKERIKEIEDPDRQRKLEERELRRERKKAAPKMKQLKVKAM